MTRGQYELLWFLLRKWKHFEFIADNPGWEGKESLREYAVDTARTSRKAFFQLTENDKQLRGHLVEAWNANHGERAMSTPLY
jgi:hypothetical protein